MPRPGNRGIGQHDMLGDATSHGGNFRVAEPVRRGQHRRPRDIPQVKHGKLPFDDRPRLVACGQPKVHDAVALLKNHAVKQPGAVACHNDDAFRRVLHQELLEHDQNPPVFLGELGHPIEDEHAIGLPQCVQHLPEFRFAFIFGMGSEQVESHRVEGDSKLTRQGLGCRRFPSTGRASEQESADRLQPMEGDFVPLALFHDDVPESPTVFYCEYQVAELRIGIADG